jgi:hypothetical protein
MPLAVCLAALMPGVSAVPVAPVWTTNMCGRISQLKEVSLARQGSWSIDLGQATSRYLAVAMYVPAPPGDHYHLFGNSPLAPGAAAVLQIAIKTPDGRVVDSHGGKLQDWGLGGAVTGEPLWYNWVFDLKDKGQGPFTLAVAVSKADPTIGPSHLEISFVNENCMVSSTSPSKRSSGGSPSNCSVIATVRPVTPLACASVAPVRPARYALR